MKTDTQPYAEIADAANALAALCQALPAAGVPVGLETLHRDIAADFYSVVFVGEFNRGKSTLINALLGHALLPMDVTPTTATINVLRHNYAASIRVHRLGHAAENRACTLADLSLAMASLGAEQEVDYIEIGLPAPTLEANTVLVDTPGLDDLNANRVAITSRFIPRADAVVFVLNAKNALNRSERDFLAEAISKSGITRIIFAVNFADTLDAEERADLLADLPKRAAGALPAFNGPICLVSGRAGLAAAISGDKAAWAVSGLAELAAAVEGLRHHRVADKRAHLCFRLTALLDDFGRELAGAIEIAGTSQEELAEHVAALDADQARNEERKQAMAVWCGEREQDLRLMLHKSLQTFQTEIATDLNTQVRAYHGSTFKSFVEDVLGPALNKRFKNWIDAHGRALDRYMQQVEERATQALASAYALRITVPRRRGGVWNEAVDGIRLTARDANKNWIVESGLIAGSASVALGFMFAPMAALVPFVVLPFLREFGAKESLDHAKKAFLQDLDTGLRAMMARFEGSLIGYISEEMKAIVALAETRYAAMAENHYRRAREKLDLEHRPEETARELARLDGLRQQMVELRARVQPAPALAAGAVG